jgi:hypothetical protein
LIRVTLVLTTCAALHVRRSRAPRRNSQAQTCGHGRLQALTAVDPLHVFAQRLRRLWRLVLGRRSQCGQAIWDRLTPIFERWIPEPRILHPYALERFVATHPRWEPYASTRSYGSVRGAISDGHPYRVHYFSQKLDSAPNPEFEKVVYGYAMIQDQHLRTAVLDKLLLCTICLERDKRLGDSNNHSVTSR